MVSWFVCVSGRQQTQFVCLFVCVSQEGSRHSVLVRLFVCVRKAVDIVSWFVCLFVCVSGRQQTQCLGFLFVCVSQGGSRPSVLVFCLFVCLREAADLVSWFVCLYVSGRQQTWCLGLFVCMSQGGSRPSVLVCLFVCLRKAVGIVSWFVCLRKAVRVGKVSWFVCLCVSGRQQTVSCLCVSLCVSGGSTHSVVVFLFVNSHLYQSHKKECSSPHASGSL